MGLAAIIGWAFAHQAAISGVFTGLLQIIGGASVVVAATPAPKKVGGLLDTAHSVVSAAALDFSKFTKTPNGARSDN